MDKAFELKIRQLAEKNGITEGYWTEVYEMLPPMDKIELLSINKRIDSPLFVELDKLSNG